MTEHFQTLDTLLRGLGRVGQGRDVRVTGLELDSRRVRPGDVFVALSGGQTHGLRFAAEAQAAGAVAIVHDGRGYASGDIGIPMIAIEDLTSKLAELARRMWSNPAEDMDLIAVTGTNGKTSVAWLMAQALDGAMIGTLGAGRPGQLAESSLTTPDVFSVYRTLAELRASGIERVVLEASSHALAQGRLEGLSFSSVIFTTLGHDHLDYHESRAEYGRAKSKLFHGFPSRRRLINLDDDFGRQLAGQLDAPGLVRFSLVDASGAEATATLKKAGLEGIEATLCLPAAGAVDIESRLIGRVNLYNLLIVAIELDARGWNGADIAACLANLQPVPGRMEPLSGGSGKLVVIDYSHTPDALETALKGSRELAQNDLWCVFGCGGDRDRAKRPRMGRIAESLADHVVLTDDNPRSEPGLAIVREIQAGMERPTRCRIIRDRGAAIAHAIQSSRRGDVVLVAGKGHESVQIIGNQVLPFSDRDAAASALEAAA